MEISIENYRGFEIVYVEGYTDGFRIKGEDVNKTKLSDLRKYIDRIIRNKFGKLNAIKIDYREMYEEVKVTSNDGNYYWIESKKGRRERVSEDLLKELSKENLDKLKKVEEIKESISKLRDEISKIMKSLEGLKRKEESA